MPALPPKTLGGPLVHLRSRRPSATTASGASRPRMRYYGADAAVPTTPAQRIRGLLSWHFISRMEIHRERLTA